MGETIEQRGRQVIGVANGGIMSAIAVVGSAEGVFQLNQNIERVILSMIVKEPGVYLVFARVLVFNGDSDRQVISVRVTHDNGTYNVDRVAIEPQNGTYFIALQGTLQVDADHPKVLELRCATYSGMANDPKIFAVQVDDFRFD